MYRRLMVLKRKLILVCMLAAFGLTGIALAADMPLKVYYNPWGKGTAPAESVPGRIPGPWHGLDTGNCHQSGTSGTHWGGTPLTVGDIKVMTNSSHMEGGDSQENWIIWWKGSGGPLVNCGNGPEISNHSNGWYELIFEGLTAGTEYEITVYHNDPQDRWTGNVSITGSGGGAGSGTAVNGNVTKGAVDITECGKTQYTWVSNGGTTTIRTNFGSQPVQNGFILRTPNPTVAFASASSADLEAVSPAQFEVTLGTTDPAETYTVDYAVVGGGTATAGQDYIMPGGGPAWCWSYPTQCHGDTDDTGDVKGSDFLDLKNSWYKCDPDRDYNPCADFDHDGCVKGSDFLILKNNWYQTVEANCPPEGGPATLTFNPGETSKIISMEIIDDGLNEQDETVLLKLSNPTGTDLQIVLPDEHVYTIVDPRSAISFEKDVGHGWEDTSAVSIPVNISEPRNETLTVDYAVGGTATSPDDYSLLGSGTLTFDPGQTTQTIELAIVDDGVDELDETIVITLINLVDVKLGAITEYTYTIRDWSQFHLKVDLGYIGRPQHLTV